MVLPTPTTACGGAAPFKGGSSTPRKWNRWRPKAPSEEVVMTRE